MEFYELEGNEGTRVLLQWNEMFGHSMMQLFMYMLNSHVTKYNYNNVNPKNLVFSQFDEYVLRA